MRDTEVILSDLNQLVRSKGYIYALCMLILEDFHYEIEHIHEINYKEHLGMQEISLLVGFLLHQPIDFSHPSHPTYLLSLKKESIALIKELEQAILQESHQVIKNSLKKTIFPRKTPTQHLNFFVKEGSIIEPIIYSGEGNRLYPYEEILKKRYAQDEEWMKAYCGFTIDEALLIMNRIQKRLHKKFQRFYSFMMKSRELRGAQFDMDSTAWQSYFYPYLDLFNSYEETNKETDISKMDEDNWKCFYQNLLDLFTIQRSDFGTEEFTSHFLARFTTDQVAEYNEQFTHVSDFNHYRTKPILLLEPGGDDYLIPLSYLLYLVLYEAPLGWMVEDKEYHDKGLQHASEFCTNIVHDLLGRVYYHDQIFKNVRVELADGRFEKIDLLCVVNNKALCVCTQSERLSEISRNELDRDILGEFKDAIREVYNDSLNQREYLLSRNSRLIDSQGKPIRLAQKIDEVFLMGVTSKNYPTITHQAHMLLDKRKEDPYPVFLTVFELDMLLHYLKTPFTLLYYLRQRSRLTNYFIASEEMAYLGYHLCKRLHPILGSKEIYIEDRYAQYIDLNFYPYKLGVDSRVSEGDDPIRNRWHNEWFSRLCTKIKQSDLPDKIDILFHLFDLHPQSVDRIMNQVKDLKEQAKKDQVFECASVFAIENKLGLSYAVHPSADLDELVQNMTTYCNLHKYAHKADYWLGFGSLAFSNEPYDYIIYRNDPWVYDKETRQEAKKKKIIIRK